MADMEKEDVARKLLEKMGVQPHNITKLIRQTNEHETNGDEIVRYANEIMGLEGEHLIWSMARGLDATLSLFDDPRKDLFIQVVLGTIALSQAKQTKPKEADKG